jgi:hypothetical protein
LGFDYYLYSYLKLSIGSSLAAFGSFSSMEKEHKEFGQCKKEGITLRNKPVLDTIFLRKITRTDKS